MSNIEYEMQMRKKRVRGEMFKAPRFKFVFEAMSYLLH